MDDLTAECLRERLKEVVDDKSEYPSASYHGRGIVICAGGGFFTSAWISINLLRFLGCKLPIQLWHLGKEEMNEEMCNLVQRLGVECVNAFDKRKTLPARRLNGWELKSYSILYSSFTQVLLLDADNICIRNPEYLFEMESFKRWGAVFWPDRGRLAKDREIWNICDVEYQDEPEFESGQILVNKSKCWRALKVALHLNEHSDYYYKFIYGDKETFHMAFRRINQPYLMPDKLPRPDHPIFVQYDFDQQAIFQHGVKWAFNKNTKIPAGFIHSHLCKRALITLQNQWNGKVESTAS